MAKLFFFFDKSARLDRFPRAAVGWRSAGFYWMRACGWFCHPSVPV